MPDLHYEDPVLARLYDLDSGWSEDRDFYLALAGEKPKRILDLGCGTGLLCDAFAGKGHLVTGVDPAKAMLEIARKKPNGSRVEWIAASAEHVRLEKRFDLVAMTGNAFMVMLEDEAIDATIRTMRFHLADGGIAAFECRNPRLEWPSRWDYEMRFELDGTPVSEFRRFDRMQGPIMRFSFRYVFPDREIVTTSAIRFSSHDEIHQRLTLGGFQVRGVFGGWKGERFEPATSEIMVFLAEAG
jgi:SAM-dependent methyltransferase